MLFGPSVVGFDFAHHRSVFRPPNEPQRDEGHRAAKPQPLGREAVSGRLVLDDKVEGNPKAAQPQTKNGGKRITDARIQQIRRDFLNCPIRWINGSF